MKTGNAQKNAALSIFWVSFLFMCLLSFTRNAPGYMDESYYFLGGQNLYRGQGFSENILWNYLDDPAGIPHPSHLYWMPGASLVAFGGMLLLGNEGYFAATFLFSVIASVIPAITYLLARYYVKDPFLSWMASGFSFFGGYYLIYYSTVETFTLYMLLGSIFIGVAALWRPMDRWSWIYKAAVLGLVAGLMHLTRADGILWLGCGIFVWVFGYFSVAKTAPWQKSLMQAVLLITVTVAVYLLVMFPWYSRNIHLFGQLSVPGASQTMFLTQYDDLYIYPASQLTFRSFLGHGVGQLLVDRVRSMGSNLFSLLGVQQLVFLLPFTLLALWRRRKEFLVIYLLIVWAAIFILMSIVFPFSGSRGGYFHSASALQIWLNIFAAMGFGDFIRWMVQKRGWKELQSKRVLGIGFIGIFAISSISIAVDKLYPTDFLEGGWGSDQILYTKIDRTLTELGIPDDSPILVIDPPSYTVFTQRPSLVIPNGGVVMVVDVMERYGVDILVLQEDHPQKLRDLYSGEEKTDLLVKLYSQQDFQIWQIN